MDANGVNTVVITCIVDTGTFVAPQTPLFYDPLDAALSTERKMLQVSPKFKHTHQFIGVALSERVAHSNMLAVAIGGAVNMNVDDSWTELNKDRAPTCVLCAVECTDESCGAKFEPLSAISTADPTTFSVAGVLLDFDATLRVVRLLLLPGVDEMRKKLPTGASTMPTPGSGTGTAAGATTITFQELKTSLSTDISIQNGWTMFMQRYEMSATDEVETKLFKNVSAQQKHDQQHLIEEALVALREAKTKSSTEQNLIRILTQLPE
ncbi:MAG: hypothetical protein VW491_04810 [Gammaproteobacteria bacterium]